MSKMYPHLVTAEYVSCLKKKVRMYGVKEGEICLECRRKIKKLSDEK